METLAGHGLTKSQLCHVGPKSVPFETFQTADSNPVESTGCERRGIRPFGTADIVTSAKGRSEVGYSATLTLWRCGGTSKNWRLLHFERRTGLHCFRALPPPGDGLSSFSDGKGYDSAHRPGDSALVPRSPTYPARADTLTRTVDSGTTRCLAAESRGPSFRFATIRS